jgi:hypothetical protein
MLLAVGSGTAVMARESRNVVVGEFDRVHFSGAGTVHLTQGGPSRLAVQGEHDILEALRIETHDGVLYIKSPRNPRGLVLELRVANLEEFISEGDGRITGNDLSFDVLRLEGNGGGSFQMQRLEARELAVSSGGTTRFDLTGQVGHQVVEINGTGAYRAGELISNSTSVHVAGRSDVRLWAEELLDVVVAGSADIRYAGAAQVEQRISGVAQVLRIPQIAI